MSDDYDFEEAQRTLDAFAEVQPPALPNPCDECPWRRVAAAGWLGPHTAEEWANIAHAEGPIACHKTAGDDGWLTSGVKQCKGSAIYRANVGKMPRDPAIAVGPVDRKSVFSTPIEFIRYHNRDEE